MKIRPSTKLAVVTVHKIGDFAKCDRYYYWRWIRNLESVWMNRAFYYGSRSGAGAEALMQGKSWRQAQAAMKAERRRYLNRYQVKEADKEAICIDEQLIDVILQGFRQTEEFKHIKMNDGQSKIKVRLSKSGLWLLGTKDGMGTYRGKTTLFEEKNLKSISDMLLEDLSQDKQINGYAYGDRLAKKPVVPQCLYMIFKKPTKIIKSGKKQWTTTLLPVDKNGVPIKMGAYEKITTRHPQTVDEFIYEIAADVYRDTKSYYNFKLIRLGRLQVAEVGYDIESHAADLVAKYERLGDDLLDPHCWGRSDACSNYSGCEFRSLCSNLGRREIYMSNFQMRELRYEEEHDELE